MSWTVKQQKVTTSKAILLNFKQKLLNQVLYYSDGFILITGNAANDTHVAVKNCAPFSACKTVINDVFVYKADHIHIAIVIYNLTET